jgi:hypothetical protein
MDELGVYLLAEVEVRDERVLEEVGEEVPADDERQRRGRLERERFGQHPEERDREQETGADRDERAEHDVAPLAARGDHPPTEDVAERGQRCEDEAQGS